MGQKLFCAPAVSAQFGVGVHLTQREMAEHEAHKPAEMLAQSFHRKVSLTAVRAFEVSVLDKGDLGCLRTQYVIAAATGTASMVDSGC